MSDRTVVGVGVGGWYPRGIARLEESVRGLGVDCDLLTWRGEYPPGCPPHAEQPYAFKIAALEMALVKGYGATIWCDSSVWFTHNPGPLFEYIEKKGYWFMTQGWYVSQWCSDAALKILDIKREDYWNVRMVAATMFGLDMKSDIARQVLGYMRARTRDGSLRGPWKNDPNAGPSTGGQKVGFCSKDKRVLGHRHDQTALSVVVHQLGLDVEMHPSYFEYKWKDSVPNPKCVALAQGM